MRHLSLVALTLLLAVGPLAAVDLTQPESAIAVPAQAIKSNDLVGLFKALPAADQEKAKAEWQKARSQMSPSDKAEFNEFLNKMLATDAVDRIVTEAEPQLKDMNPAELAAGVQMFGGMMAMQLAQNPSTKEQGALLQQLVMDVAAWLPTSGVEQPAKLREAATHFVNSIKALGVSSADDLIALDLETLLTRSGDATKEMKKAFTVYGLDPNSFLGSLALTNVAGAGETRTATLSFTAFGKPYQMPANLKLKDGYWTFDADKAKQDLAPMMGGMMGPPGME